MKGNTEKCHLMLSAGDSNQIQIENSLIKGSLCEKILGVKFDDKLTFDQHFKSLCPNAKAYDQMQNQKCLLAGFLQVSQLLSFCYMHATGILGLARQNIRYLVFIFFNQVLYLRTLLT